MSNLGQLLGICELYLLLARTSSIKVDFPASLMLFGCFLSDCLFFERRIVG
ncbi:hypothetical protein D9M70_336320 [compost metagenome]